MVGPSLSVIHGMERMELVAARCTCQGGFWESWSEEWGSCPHQHYRFEAAEFCKRNSERTVVRWAHGSGCGEFGHQEGVRTLREQTLFNQRN